jgi:hypothetical protein
MRDSYEAIEIIKDTFGNKNYRDLLSAVTFDENGCREVSDRKAGVRLYETSNRNHFCRVGLALKGPGLSWQFAIVEKW